MSEPNWLPLDLIKRLHDRQIEIHGGLAGTRDHGLLESAIARPVKAWSCGEEDLFTLASLYAAGLIRNHLFLDGRKQIGFLSALLFREANGCKMAAPMAERLAFTLQLAASEIDEKICADWLRRSCIPV
ncbi:type II toxin-antitoxin system death-on-curing family toxin [Hyphomonas sp.]|uniref:type II toxin-antitoxin system death-on-curing family toxin n=1 Tax=Hyphomonas sp. TaxID=87 RepID=UPI0025BDCB40|nr:type II toxin-antitoxin system death-on-curing family toxin [Hyphomonas sp.]